MAEGGGSARCAAELHATGVYLASCPSCGGPVTDDRLLSRLPCYRCLPDRPPVESVVDVVRELERRGRGPPPGSPLARYARVEEEARRVEQIFEKATGSRLWSAQRTWVRRALKGKSFAIIAPTGVGKTTFGILMAVYFGSRCSEGVRPCKAYIVVPTTPLVEMVEEKARKLAEAAGLSVRVLAIHSRLTARERRERLRRLVEGDYDVLVTTARFLQTRAPDIIAGARRDGGFKFIFVDDVDAVLKSGRSVEAVLRVAGFPDELIERDRGVAWELMRLRQRLARLVERASRGDERAREEAKQLYGRIRELERVIEEARARAATVVVSSATGRPRGRMVRLFNVLLGFQAGSRSETVRNIVDAYALVEPDRLEERVVELVTSILARCRRCGGLVYVPVDRGVEYAERLAQLLRMAGVRAEPFTSRNVEALERFRRGEVDVLVGVAVYYGVAVRGLDIPERICFAVFAGAPRLRFSARFEDPHPTNILRALSVLADYAPRDVAEEAERLLARLRRLYQRMSQAAVAAVAEELRAGPPRTPAAREFAAALDFVRRALSREDVWRALESAADLAIVRSGDRSYIVLPDAATYIQASGRTSRLYAGGITRGLSVVVESDERILRGLVRRTRWWVEAEWRRVEDLDLDALVKELEASREELVEVVEGRRRPEAVGRELVTTALLIVESPNKARTIASFFGRPSVRDVGPVRVYEVSTGDYMLLVAASGGHVYDLVKPRDKVERPDPRWLVGDVAPHVEELEGAEVANVHGVLVARRGGERLYLPLYAPIARCAICGTQWTLSSPRPSPKDLKCPICDTEVAVRTGLDVIEALRDLATEVDVVLIGTDPDTEGEKIGWDLAALIAPYARSIARVEFHEITRRAILEAIRNPKPFGTHEMAVYDREAGREESVCAINLVRAQIVRRVEDRWIGFTLSPILWTRFWLDRFCGRELWERLLEHFGEEAKTAPIRELGERLKAAVSKERNPARRAKLRATLRMLEACCGEEGRLTDTCRPSPNYNLSAGRVQTPVLGWVVERTLLSKKGTRIVVSVTSEEAGVRALTFSLEELPGELGERARELTALAERARRCLETFVREGALGPDCEGIVSKGCAGSLDSALRGGCVSQLGARLAEISNELRRLRDEAKRALGSEAEIEVEVVREDEVEVRPPPPFTTDAMLAEAAARLRLPPPQAMRLAQDLFEMGFITYHRTDSTRVSDVGIAVAREYLREALGEEGERLFAPRTWGTGGAHEAIRPTRPIDAERLRRLVEEGIIQPARQLTRNHYRLYDLIFRRFIASQMRPARLRRQVVRVRVRLAGHVLERELERYVGVVEEGFLKVYPAVRLEEPARPGTYKAEAIVEARNYVGFMTQSELIRMMRERGIGRPSTYAKIVETLFRRGYVGRPHAGEDEKEKARETDRVTAKLRGVSVYDFITALFPRLVSESVTRELERRMDEVERGADYRRVLSDILSELEASLRERGLGEYLPPRP